VVGAEVGFFAVAALVDILVVTFFFSFLCVCGGVVLHRFFFLGFFLLFIIFFFSLRYTVGQCESGAADGAQVSVFTREPDLMKS
jgi:hypothetical protein